MAFVPLISLLSLHFWKKKIHRTRECLPRVAWWMTLSYPGRLLQLRVHVSEAGSQLDQDYSHAQKSLQHPAPAQSSGRSLFPLSHRVMQEALSSLLHRAPPCAACATVFLCVMKDLFRSLLPSVPNNGTWSTLRRSTASFPSLGLQLLAPAVLSGKAGLLQRPYSVLSSDREPDAVCVPLSFPPLASVWLSHHSSLAHEQMHLTNYPP